MTADFHADIANGSLNERARPPLRLGWWRLALLAAVLVVGVSTHWPNLELPQAQRWGYDKGIHLAVFLGLTLLAGRARLLGLRAAASANALAALGLVGLLAYVDEWTQPWVGRRFSLLDLLANVTGVGVGYAILLVRARSHWTPIPSGGTVACDRVVDFETSGRPWSQAFPGAVPPLRSSKIVLLARGWIALFLPWVALMLFTPTLRLDMEMPLPMGPTGQLELRADHLLHLFGALALTWLVAAARPFGLHRVWPARLAAVLGVGGLGPAIELAQARLGRGFELGDLMAHELGVLMATLLAGAVLAVGKGPRASGLGTREGEEEEKGSGEESCKAATSGRAPEDTAAPGKQARHDTPPESPPESSFPDPAPEARGPKPEARSSSSRSFIGSAVLVSGMTLVSRVTGLVRESAMGAVFGLTGIADAFMIGFIVPNLFRRLFGEGALAAAFIPAYAKLVEGDRVAAQRLASLVIAILLAVVGGLTLLGEVGLMFALRHEGWTADAHLAIRLTMAMLPYAPLVCLVALLGGILQVHGKFGAAAAAPILLNVLMIAAIIAASQFGQSDADLRQSVFLVAASVLVAGLIQLAWLLIVTWRYEPLTRRFTGAGPAFKGMVWTMLPMVMGLAIFQINALLDVLLAFGLSPKPDGPEHLTILGRAVPFPIPEGGAATALTFAQRLYQFPLGVFGIAIATAIFPALARAAARPALAGRTEFEEVLHHGLRLTVFIGLPASVGLVLIRLPLTRLIFQYGDLSLADAGRIARILAGYGSAIWAYSMVHVLTRAFYAIQDARTPLVLSTIMVAFNFTLNLTLVWFLGAAGLAWSTAITAACQVVLLILAMTRVVQRPVDASVWRGWGRTAVATVVMGGGLGAVLMAVDMSALSRLASAGLLAALVLGGGAVYVLAAWALRTDELRWLLKRDVG